MKRTFLLTVVLAALLSATACADIIGPGEMLARSGALPAVLVFGIVATVYGVIDMIHCFVTPIPVLDYTGLAVFLGVLVWYMVYTTKLKNKYF